jgi:hypothetical protein
MKINTNYVFIGLLIVALYLMFMKPQTSTFWPFTRSPPPPRSNCDGMSRSSGCLCQYDWQCTNKRCGFNARCN